MEFSLVTELVHILQVYRGFFFFFFFQFCSDAKLVIIQKKHLAKFGYRPKMKATFFPKISKSCELGVNIFSPTKILYTKCLNHIFQVEKMWNLTPPKKPFA
jgi:hypothetical protein